MKSKSTIYFVSVCFFIFVHLLFITTTSAEEKSNFSNLNLPFPVDFTEKEIKFLNSLSQIDLEKIIRIIKLISETKNQNSKINQFFSGTKPNNSSQPTTYSNSPSAQTPYYNSGTGQYQSTPVSGGGGGGSGVGNIGSSGSGSGAANSLPFSGGQNSPAGNSLLSPQNSLPQTPLGALAQGLNQGLNQGTQGVPVDTVDLSKLNIPPQCKTNYGVINCGKCFDIENASAHLKETTALACAAIGKPICSASVVRGMKCPHSGVGKSSMHNARKAIDVSQRGLNSEEKRKVYEVFRKRGYMGVGCYGLTGHVHFDNGTPRRWYEGPCPYELQLAGYSK